MNIVAIIKAQGQVVAILKTQGHSCNYVYRQVWGDGECINISKEENVNNAITNKKEIRQITKVIK